MHTALMISRSVESRHGGISTHVAELLRKGSDNDLRYIVATIGNKGLIEKEKSLKIHLYKLYSIPLLGDRFFLRNISKKPIWAAYKAYSISLLGVISCYALLKHGRDVEFIDAQGYSALMVAGILSKIFSKKYFFTSHMKMELEKNKLLDRAIIRYMQRSERIFVSSSIIRDSLIKAGVDKSKIVRYTPWTEHDDSKVMKAAYPDTKKGRINILFVGRISKEKRLPEILEHLDDKRYHIRIIGEGMHLDLDKPSSKIEHIGPVPNHKLGRYYEWADYTIIPGIYSGHMPRTAIESLSHGTPLLETQVSKKRFHWSNALKKYKLLTDNGSLVKKNGSVRRRCIAYAHKHFSSKNYGTLLSQMLPK